MSTHSLFAILLDGAFVIKRVESRLRRFPAAADVQRLCDVIAHHPHLRRRELLRAYFYHAPPAEDVLTNPIDKSRLDLALSPTHVRHTKLLSALELHQHLALHLGEAVAREWRLGSKAMESLASRSRAIEACDLVPNISQKGVDLRIGLDIARLSLRRLVDVIVVVTGDSDLVPAFSFARREGLRIYLDHLGHGITRSLKAHCDVVLPDGLSNFARWPQPKGAAWLTDGGGP